jgi:hypothetical protein
MSIRDYLGKLRASFTHQSLMKDPTTHKLSNVFGTSRDVPESYVERDGVDDRFLNDLARDKHLVIHGSSKQGKTCLRKHHLLPSEYIVIQCTRDATKATLYEMLLKHAGVQCEVSHATTLRGSHKLSAKLGAEGGLPYLAKASGEGGYEHEAGNERVNNSKDFEIDPEDPNDVIRVLEAGGFKKYIVIEDFHYLDENVQQALAIDLKVFHEISGLTFLVVGVWLEANRLTLYNGDLNGRIAVINADHWETVQLHQVITLGASLLNIEFSSAIQDSIVEGSEGNVGLLQEVCYRICEQYQIWSTQQTKVQIGNSEDVARTFRAIADEQASRYKNFLARFAEGLGESKLEMYKWIGYAVVSVGLDELRRGVRPNTLFHRIKAVHPSRATLQLNNVNQALDRVGAVQFKHKLQPLIFDFGNSELVVVDANFIVFLKTHSREELLEYLGIVLEPSQQPDAEDGSK